MEVAAFSFVLGVVASAIGYFFKRWLEGQSAKEKIQETIQLVSLKKDLGSGNFTLDALAALKSQITSKASISQKYQTEIFEKIESAAKDKDSVESIEYQPYSQQEMNRYAFHLADLADRELEYVVQSFEGYLSTSELVVFRKVQKAWKNYASMQSDLESLEAEGGTLQPLLRASALRLMTIERAAEIKVELNRRIKAEFAENLR